jgi:ribosomal protection tetracycline resistance protein
MRTLNLGILAHVDAGKTSLTERLLYAAGVIDEIGSVDEGTTQTDNLELERQRGITIKSAVVSFVVHDVTVNLIDTPGHPDFIAEVERALGVLDGAVLVISAVEGVQPQTGVLFRTLARLRIPAILFVNKIDRRGADAQRTLARIRERLTSAIVAMGRVHAGGTPAAAFEPYPACDAEFAEQLIEVLAERDDALLAAYVDDAVALPNLQLHAALVDHAGRAGVHPVFFGSAITGAGVDALMAAITQFLPARESAADVPPSAVVFKMERGAAGERVAFARVFAGTLRTRDRVLLRGEHERTVTAMQVFESGASVARTCAAAGQIVKIWGLGDVRIGDVIGTGAHAMRHHFAPPTLETVIGLRDEPDASNKTALHTALEQLAEQDPLINLRQDDLRHELYVSLYGEVQKEVIQQTLANDFGIDVEFLETTPICIERPIGTGAALDVAPYPFIATVGLRVEPGPADSGIGYRLEYPFGALPVSFHTAIEDAVHATFKQGLYGWPVTDCIVSVTHCIRLRDFGASTAAEHRNLTPLVLMAALARAGTTVCEPIQTFRLEFPVDASSAMARVLARLDAIPLTTQSRGSLAVIEGHIPAAQVHALQQQLPAVARGEGVLETRFDGYRPIHGRAPSRPRTDSNPLNRKEYLLHVKRRVALEEKRP